MPAKLTAAQAAKLGLAKRPHKYRACPTVVDNIRFASKMEAVRYGELKQLERAGKIKRLTLQPRFPLTVCGVTIGHYVGDFQYFDVETNKVVTEDCKGFQTPLFKWKKRHLEREYGFQLAVTGGRKPKKRSKRK